MFSFKLLLSLAALAAAPALEAQVRVVESRPLENSGAQTQGSSGAAGANMQAELYFQLQSLQQEVLQLRGLVEEQAHEIKRLKQQRMDDYLDLDRRLSRLSGGGGQNPVGETTETANTSPADAGQSLGADGASETETYRSAYQLLRDRKLDEAISAFNAYLAQYPRGNYAGNSYYWLGEIYLLKADLEQARDWFSKLLRDFPDDRKVSDAKFKLGKVHHQLGDEAKAQELLQEVAGNGSDAARLARRYLEENFQ